MRGGEACTRPAARDRKVCGNKASLLGTLHKIGYAPGYCGGLPARSSGASRYTVYCPGGIFFVLRLEKFSSGVLMNKRLTGIAFVAFVLSWPVSASLSQPQTQTQPIQAQAQSQPSPLLHGDGWRLVRSLELGNSGNYIHMVLIDSNRDMDKAVYGAALSKICRSEPDFCRVRFWNQERLVSQSVSFKDAEFKALRAEYIFNRAGGVQQLLYACTVVSDKNQCFSN
jgi:hypothetical protein